MFQYMITAHEGFNNKEIIWAINLDANGIDAGVTKIAASEPTCQKRVTVRGPEAINGTAPTWAACKPFLYGKNGLPPAKRIRISICKASG